MYLELISAYKWQQYTTSDSATANATTNNNSNTTSNSSADSSYNNTKVPIELLNNLYNLRSVYSHLQQYDKMNEKSVELINILSTYNGGHSTPQMLSVILQYAHSNYKTSNLSEAIVWYNKALLCCEELYGKESIEYMSVLGRLAGVLSTARDYDRAIECYKVCYEGRKVLLGQLHPDTLLW